MSFKIILCHVLGLFPYQNLYTFLPSLIVISSQLNASAQLL
jgi:hypothetical protein